MTLNAKNKHLKMSILDILFCPSANVDIKQVQKQIIKTNQIDKIVQELHILTHIMALGSTQQTKCVQSRRPMS